MTIKKTLLHAGIAFGAAVGLAVLPVLPASAATTTYLNSDISTNTSATVHWSTKRTHVAAGAIAFKGDPDNGNTCGTVLYNRLRSGLSGTSTAISTWSSVSYTGYKSFVKTSGGTSFAAGTVFYISSTYSGGECFGYPMTITGWLTY